jgi:uncharacterized protein (UPF0548 family)
MDPQDLTQGRDNRYHSSYVEVGTDKGKMAEGYSIEGTALGKGSNEMDFQEGKDLVGHWDMHALKGFQDHLNSSKTVFQGTSLVEEPQPSFQMRRMGLKVLVLHCHFGKRPVEVFLEELVALARSTIELEGWR